MLQRNYKIGIHVFQIRGIIEGVGGFEINQGIFEEKFSRISICKRVEFLKLIFY